MPTRMREHGYTRARADVKSHMVFRLDAHTAERPCVFLQGRPLRNTCTGQPKRKMHMRIDQRQYVCTRIRLTSLRIVSEGSNKKAIFLTTRHVSDVADDFSMRLRIAFAKLREMGDSTAYRRATSKVPHTHIPTWHSNYNVRQYARAL